METVVKSYNFTGNWVLLILLSIIFIAPGIIYFFLNLETVETVRPSTPEEVEMYERRQAALGEPARAQARGQGGTTRCRGCGETIQAGVKFCAFCGTQQ